MKLRVWLLTERLDNARLAFRTETSQTNHGQVGSSICDSRWHQIIATGDGINGRLYVDGNINGSAGVLAAGVLNSTNVYIGYVNGTKPFQGNITIVKVYGRALTASEVTQSFINEKIRYGF